MTTSIQFPSVTISDATNTSIDNSFRQINGLNDNTTYNVRAILTHNSTGRRITIDKVLDDTGNIFQFTTLINESITIGIDTSLQKTQTSLSYEIREFSSNKDHLYNIECMLYYWDITTSQYILMPSQTKLIESINNALFTILGGGGGGPLAYPLVNFTNLTHNTKYKSTCKIYNTNLGQYYNGGQEITLFNNVNTLDYLISFAINPSLTTRTTNSITLYFTELMDNRDPVVTTPSSVVFDSVKFRGVYEMTGSPGVMLPLDVPKTNVPFIASSEGRTYQVLFSGLEANKTYAFEGLFTRNTLYNDVRTDFSYSVTTFPYQVLYTLTDLVVSTTQFVFRLLSLTDNTGTGGNFTSIKFYTYKKDGGGGGGVGVGVGETLVGNPYEYLNVPEQTTRTFTIDLLEVNTEYRIQAEFIKSGQYTVTIDNLFTQFTSNDPTSDPLDATIVIDDDNIATTPASVTFKVIDFESPEFANSETHTVQLIAMTPSQIQAEEQGNILQWDFTSQSRLVDIFNNVFVVDVPSNVVFDQVNGITTLANNVYLRFTPADWAIFDGLGNNFKMETNIIVPSGLTEAKFHMKFNTSVVSSELTGFNLQLYNDGLMFSGCVRISDGNERFLMLNMVYDVSTHPGGFYDTFHSLEFDFETYPYGTRVGESGLYNSFAMGRIIIDNTVVMEQYIVDRTAFAPNEESGIFLYTSGSGNGYYEMYLAQPNIMVKDFRMGVLRTSSGGGGAGATS